MDIDTICEIIKTSGKDIITEYRDNLVIMGLLNERMETLKSNKKHKEYEEAKEKHAWLADKVNSTLEKYGDIIKLYEAFESI